MKGLMIANLLLLICIIQQGMTQSVVIFSIETKQSSSGEDMENFDLLVSVSVKAAVFSVSSEDSSNYQKMVGQLGVEDQLIETLKSGSILHVGSCAAEAQNKLYWIFRSDNFNTSNCDKAYSLINIPNLPDNTENFHIVIRKADGSTATHNTSVTNLKGDYVILYTEEDLSENKKIFKVEMQNGGVFIDLQDFSEENNVVSSDLLI